MQETKLPNTPFSKICLGMRSEIRSSLLSSTSRLTLYSLIADGEYKGTTLGRNAWESLIGSQASLQSKLQQGRVQCRLY